MWERRKKETKGREEQLAAITANNKDIFMEAMLIFIISSDHFTDPLRGLWSL